jgi:hypothetical protein
MIGRRLVSALALCVAIVAALPAGVAAGPAAHAEASDDQFVVGTILYPDGSHGTSFAFHVPGAKADILTYGLTKRVVLRGPAGWNHGHALVTKCVQIGTEYFDTCDNWANVKPVAGQYTATGAGGASWTATIDTTSVVPPQAVTARVVTTGLSVSWRRGTSTGAYYVDLEDVHGRVLVDALVPGGARKHVFAQPKLTKGAHYWVTVDAYPTNVIKNIPLSTHWAISGTDFYLTAP